MRTTLDKSSVCCNSVLPTQHNNGPVNSDGVSLITGKVLWEWGHTLYSIGRTTEQITDIHRYLFIVCYRFMEYYDRLHLLYTQTDTDELMVAYNYKHWLIYEVYNYKLNILGQCYRYHLHLQVPSVIPTAHARPH